MFDQDLGAIMELMTILWFSYSISGSESINKYEKIAIDILRHGMAPKYDVHQSVRFYCEIHVINRYRKCLS